MKTDITATLDKIRESGFTAEEAFDDLNGVDLRLIERQFGKDLTELSDLIASYALVWRTVCRVAGEQVPYSAVEVLPTKVLKSLLRDDDGLESDDEDGPKGEA